MSSLATVGGNTGVIDLTRSATPSPNRSQGLSVSSTEGPNNRGNGFGPSDTDNVSEGAASDSLGATKKFKFKSKLSKSSAPPKGKIEHICYSNLASRTFHRSVYAG